MGEHLTPEQAEALVGSALHREVLTLEYKELAAMRSEISSEALTVLEDRVQTEENKQYSPFLPDVEDKWILKSLKEAGIDLKEEREEAVKMHEKWGLVKALQEKGIVKDTEEYSALFDKVMLTGKGLYQLLLRLKAGEKWMPIFNPGHLMPVELFKILITDAKVPFFYEDFIYEHLSKLKRIHLKDIPGLTNLHEKLSNIQGAAFKKAYKKAPALRADETGILFTPNVLEVKTIGKSATQRAQMISRGAQYLNLSDNLIRWRTQLDATKKYPDSEYCVQDPLSVFANGCVAVFFWNPVNARLHLDYYNPGIVHEFIGVRPVLR